MLFTLLALAVVAAVVSLAAKAPSGVAGLARAPGGNEERLEQQLTTDMRLDALRGREGGWERSGNIESLSKSPPRPAGPGSG